MITKHFAQLISISFFFGESTVVNEIDNSPEKIFVQLYTFRCNVYVWHWERKYITKKKNVSDRLLHLYVYTQWATWNGYAFAVHASICMYERAHSVSSNIGVYSCPLVAPSFSIKAKWRHSWLVRRTKEKKLQSYTHTYTYGGACQIQFTQSNIACSKRESCLCRMIVWMVQSQISFPCATATVLNLFRFHQNEKLNTACNRPISKYMY